MLQKPAKREESHCIVLVSDKTPQKDLQGAGGPTPPGKLTIPKKRKKSSEASIGIEMPVIKHIKVHRIKVRWIKVHRIKVPTVK